MLSIIIPSFNAARTIGDVLSHFSEPDLSGPDSGQLDIEILVIDGGSDDSTRLIAKDFDVRIIDAPRGRGFQLEAGSRAAQGRWFLFLHADTFLDSGWLDEIEQFISDSDNIYRSAYFGYRLNSPDKMARFLEYIVWLRCRVFCLPYGDQGLLISRIFYDRIGGFRKIPLMEDVDIVRRIFRFGGRRALVHLRCFAHTDACRYRNGYWRRMVRNSLCLLLWNFGARPEFLVKLYR